MSDAGWFVVAAVGGVVVAYVAVQAIAPRPAVAATGSSLGDAVDALRNLEQLYSRDDKPTTTANGATAGAVAAGTSEPSLVDKALALWGKVTAGVGIVNDSQDRW